MIWDLFVPALVRLIWCITLLVSGLDVEAINALSANSVWARDLSFVIWDLHYSILARKNAKINSSFVNQI